jgi:aerotolerance regulator-like protein/VWA domain-containing protein
MGFVSPWFLAGLATVALPIYLHLLRRQKSPPRPFSSLMFFEHSMQSSTRHRTLEHLLLLGLRIALLVLIILAFANPFARRSNSITGDRLLLIAIDNSFSMRAGSRLADAKRNATAFLESHFASGRAQVLTLGSQVRALTEPTEDRAVLRAAIDSVQPSDSRGNFAEFARVVRAMAGAAEATVDLHLFSDIQKSGISGPFNEIALPATVSLILHPVVSQTVPNWAVEMVNAPSLVGDPKKAHVEAVIAGYHTPDAMRNVSLVVNGKIIATQSVHVPAGQRAKVEFSSLDVAYGFSRCEVRIDSADALAADDSTLFAVERRDPQPVLFVHEGDDSRSSFYFRSALDSTAESAFHLQAVTVEQLAGIEPSRYAFIVLSDVLSLPAAAEDALLKYVGEGGSVLGTVGPVEARRARIPVFNQPILQTHYYLREGEGFATVGYADGSHPSLEKSNSWRGVKFYFAVRVDPGDARVLARLTDSTPLLLEKKLGQGRMLLLTSGLDNLTNDLPLRPLFVPFVEQTALYLSGAERSGGSRLVNSYVELRRAREHGIGIAVIGPDGRRALDLSGATSAQFLQLERTGFYSIKLANGRENLIGVNADWRESDLEIIPAELLTLWQSNSSTVPLSSAYTAPSRRKPYGLWWQVLVAALVIGLAESTVASRYLDGRRDTP